MSVAISTSTATVRESASHTRATVAFDRWELVRLVAETPWTRVYRARTLGSEASIVARYAIKVVRQDVESTDTARALLEREWQIGTSVRHRSLVPVLDAQLDRAPFWLAMPWLEGGTLAARIRERRLPEATAFWYARQVAEALRALDAAGWMHGDIKPSNVIIAPNGHASLIDSAFARRRNDTRWSLAAEAIGTPQYLAPETITSALRPDIRSDIYSLGVMLYELLAGRRPFVARDVAELLRAHRDQRPRPLQEFAPRLPREAAELVAAMLAKEPLRRPQNPSEVIDRLVRLEVGSFDRRQTL